MKRFFTVLFLVALFSSCSKKDENCDYDPCSLKAPSSEVTDLETWMASAGIIATKHCSGVYYTIDVAGSGATPKVCSYINFKYKGQLTNGTVFDQSTAPVGYPLSGLIEGWKKVLPLLKAGGKIKIYTPPSLGYGSQELRDNNGNVVIPANSILVFEVELVSVS